MSDNRGHEPADKTANPLNSPQTQTRQTLPDDEAVLEQPNPKTEDIDKVITPTSIKNKERDAEQLEEKNREVERELNKRP